MRIPSIQPVSQKSSGCQSSAPLKEQEKIKNYLDKRIADKYVMVFSGYSGLGYADKAALKKQISEILQTKISQYGAENIVVVAGATSEGIGMVYQLAKAHGIGTLGIVSIMAQHHAEISSACDEIVYVPDPAGSWKVLDDKGHSWMTYAASKNGIFLAFGGGEVTLSELHEANQKRIPCFIFPAFEPNPEKAAARRIKYPEADLTPVRSCYENGEFPELSGM